MNPDIINALKILNKYSFDLDFLSPAMLLGNTKGSYKSVTDQPATTQEFKAQLISQLLHPLLG